MVLNTETLTVISDLLARSFSHIESPEGASFWGYLFNKFSLASSYNQVTDHHLCSYLNRTESKYIYNELNEFYKSVGDSLSFYLYGPNSYFFYFNQAKEIYLKKQNSEFLFYLINRMSYRLKLDTRLIDWKEYINATAFHNNKTQLRYYSRYHSEFCPVESYA